MSVVSNLNDAGAGSLRAALAAAVADEVITFSVTGTILLTSGTLNVNTVNVRVAGPGSGLLTVARDAGAGNFRVFTVGAVVAAITGMTVANGRDPAGAGMQNIGTLTLFDVIFAANQATDGGAVDQESTLIATDCQFASNSATNTGGGILDHGTTTLNSCIISSNTAADGAGIWTDGTLIMNACTVASNVASASSGGIHTEGTLTLNDCQVNDNQASAQGGGINCFIGTVTLTRCCLRSNTGSTVGGLYNRLGTITVDNSTISTNTGAAIENSGGALTVTHSTVTLNSSGIVISSGGVFPSMINTILAGNTGTDLTCSDAAFLSHHHNLFGTTSVAITPGAGEVYGLNFAQLVLGPLQNNFGPTDTHELLAGSPAIDAGDNTSAPITDQRGFPRVVNTTIDIGAFEVPAASDQTACVTPGTICVTLHNPTTQQYLDAQAQVNAQALAAATAQALAQCGGAGGGCNAGADPALDTTVIQGNQSIAYDSTNDKLWIIDVVTNDILVLDPATGAVLFNVGNPSGFAFGMSQLVYDVTNGRIYASGSPTGGPPFNVYVYTASTHTLLTTVTLTDPHATGSLAPQLLAWDAARNFLWVCDTNKLVWRIDAATFAQSVVDVGFAPPTPPTLVSDNLTVIPGKIAITGQVTTTGNQGLTLIDPVTLAVTTFDLNIEWDAGYSCAYRNSNARLYVPYINGVLRINPAAPTGTDLIGFSSTSSADAFAFGLALSPCTGRIAVVFTLFSSGDNHLVYLSPVDSELTDIDTGNATAAFFGPVLAYDSTRFRTWWASGNKLFRFN